MNKKDLQNFFSADYTNFKSFADNVLAPVFGDKLMMLDYSEDMIKTKEDKNLAQKHKIVSVLHFADIDAFNEVKVFDITVDDSCSLTMSRVGIKEFVRRILFSYTQALIVFHYKNTATRSWRLSYMFKEDKQTAVTPAKRFTYVFGKNYSGKTAAERFEVLSNSEMDNAKDFIDAFSVEALTKEFFTKYEAHYKKFCKYIYDNKNDETKFGRKFTEIDDKAVRDYVKKMMGRIVFLHFLQRKGWLNGDQNFMLNTFRNSEYKDDFLDSVLEPLFFAFLNTKPEDRKVEFEKHNKQKGEKKWDKKYINEWKEIPYLNGGLFEADAEDPPASVFPAEYFEDLLVLFSEYNFTIDENDTSDAVIGVDPEMLGKIFESLLEDNKDKGAFYTPKEIVQYMCRESLVAYLVEKIGKKAAATDKAEDFVRRFVNDPYAECEKIKEEGYAKMLNDMYELLRDVKICDPAIGSGAFPMGMLNELVSCCDAINVALGTEIPRVELKKHIIQNNIYGVDIEKGAIDIARLRFWLSIVVDSEKPEALPNFDYKFMQGNSLLESYKGIDLTTTTQKKFDGQFTFFENMADCERKFLRDKLDKYFNCSNHSEKEILRKEIHEKVFNVLRADKIGIGKDHLKVTDPAELFADIDLSANDKFFLWHTWFNDVFNRPNSCNGFDIVIGNPPYIKEYTNRKAFDGFRENSPYYVGKMDIWYGFACHGLDLLNNFGVLCFIAQNNWTTSDGAKKMRKKIIKDARILQLLDFYTYMVFENADIQTMVMLFKRDSTTDNYKFDHRLLMEGAGKDDMICLLGKGNGYVKYQTPVFNRLKFTNQLFTFSDSDDIFDKISNGKTYLENKEVAQGIVFPQDFLDKKGVAKLGVGYSIGDSVFGLTQKKLEELSLSEDELQLIRPYFSSEQIHRYFVEPLNSKWLIYTDSRFKKSEMMDNYPHLKRHLDAFRSIITSDNRPYGLHRSREERFFRGEKIISLRKCSSTPSFSWCDFDCYVTQTFFLIKTARWNMKFLTGVLNSLLIAFWLRNKGKMQGSNYQVDKEPLLGIPLPHIDDSEQQPIISLVDQILAAKKTNPQADTSRIEKEIDRRVYELYGLTEDEIKIVEGNSL